MFEDRDSHPSYGLVQFNRVSSGGGKNRLFGSSINSHYTTIMLELRRAEVAHDLNENHYLGVGELIQVELSSAQFVELLTTMNVGMGVPCTIRRIAGEGRIEDPPDLPLEAEKVRDGFDAKIQGLVAKWRKDVSEAHQRLGTAKASKADREFALDLIDEMVREIGANVPWVVTQFNRATEKVLTSAKAEIDNFVVSMIQRTGLKALGMMSGNRLLGDGSAGPDTPWEE